MHLCVYVDITVAPPPNAPPAYNFEAREKELLDLSRRYNPSVPLRMKDERRKDKLTKSRLQRDLTDSTVSRNIGVPLSYTKIALESIFRGINKIEVNKKSIEKDLENNWMVIAEAIQTILRREKVPNPYETLKKITRGNDEVNKKTISEFINQLPISKEVKDELYKITPKNYLGNSQNQ